MPVNSSLRTPRAAAIAGVAFAILLSTVLILLQLASSAANDSQAAPMRDQKVTVILQLVPFVGITFLWLIGVVRDRIGAREDRFLASVLLGSGLLFIAMLFVASGIVAGMLASASSGAGVPIPATTFARRIASTLLHTYAMRMAAVFTISTATIGVRTRFIPRWVALLGYATALVLLVGADLSTWVELLFPLWVFVLSLEILVESYRGSRHDELRPEAQEELSRIA